MSNEIKIFENEEFGSVRTMEINGKPYFVGKDVADILGYQNGSRDITVHDTVLSPLWGNDLEWSPLI